MTADRTALILGATGGIGGAVAVALLRHGWRVVGMARDPAGHHKPTGTDPLAGVQWIAGDAMNADDVRRAAAGAAVIFHGVNPPLYRNWGGLVLPMIDNSIAAARAVGARVVLPGTIYNFGPDAYPNLVEDSPQHPTTRKGRIRVAMEQRLEAASGEGVPALIVRFGDFFGPMARNSWFSQGLVRPGKRLRTLRYPSPPGVGHAWSYLPDAGETVARLLDRSGELEPFARFHAQGHWDADGRQMATAIIAGVGRPQIRIKPFPWPLVGLAGRFNETLRELYEMRGLWRTSIRLDNARLVAFLGAEPHTPLNDAVRATLAAFDVR